jgi:hypothetical protein
MARAVVLAGAAMAAVLISVLAPAATAQMDSCSGDLPAVLVGNYSGMACQPVWNNFVLRVRLSVVIANSGLKCVGISDDLAV